MRRALFIQVVLLTACRNAFAFIAPSFTLKRQRQSYLARGDQPRFGVLFSENDVQSNLEIIENNSEKKSVKRIGGRARPRPRRRNINDDVPVSRRLPWWVKTVAAPIVALWLFLQLLFGGSNSTPDTYYYQSSMYESRVYGIDGKVETARKESVRSNIPGLIESQRNARSLPESSVGKPSVFGDSVDETFDRMLDQEIDSMLRIQKSFLRDFW
jgi:hypothetical protein